MSNQPQTFSFKLLLVLIMSFVVGMTKSFGCSMSVDDNFHKNLLFAHGASYVDLSLASASALAVTGYQKTFSGESSPGACPDYLTVSGRVSMAHIKSKFDSCSYAVTVSIMYYIGNDLPDGPFEEVNFTQGEAACSTSAVKKPKRILLKPKRAIKLPFPR